VRGGDGASFGSTPSTALGPACRTPRPGPETDLVDRFVAWLAGSITHSPGLCTTLFREPRLLSGFPDLVAVTWHAPTAERWTGARKQLSTGDLRLVQLLVSTGPKHTQSLQSLVGRRQVTRLPLLREAGLLIERAGTWRVRRLRDAFAVRGIIAFEAKIADWSQALAQASANRWFASESYVLLPTAPRRVDAASEAARLGVGIWIEGKNTPLLAAVTNSEQPVSFASWLFNEWAWRGASCST
jgi:hypothetical protein